MTQYLAGILLSLNFIGVYGIFAIGIVLIYRASKVLNLAHGVMAVIPAYLIFQLSQWGFPVIVSLPLAVALGGVLGWLVLITFVRPMRRLGETAQTVGTVVFLGLGIAVTAQIWSATPREAVRVFPFGSITVGFSNIPYGELMLFGVMLVLFGLLSALFKFTDLGLLMRGSAENPRAAALMGVNPELMASVTWILGGVLAGIAGILFASNTTLHPYSLPLQTLPAFLAALLGGIGSVTGAVGGAAVVGLVFGMVPLLPGFEAVQGAPQLMMALIGMGVMAMRGQTIVATDVRGGIV